MLDNKYIKILENHAATEPLLKLLYGKYKNDAEAMLYLRDKIIKDDNPQVAIFWAFHTKKFTGEMAKILINHNTYASAVAWVNQIETHANEMFELIYNNYDLFYVYSWLNAFPHYEKNYLLKIKIIQNNDLDNLILSRRRGKRNHNEANLHHDSLYRSFFQDDNLPAEYKMGIVI